MKQISLILLFLSLFFSNNFYSEELSFFKNKNKKVARVKFKLINNLIVLPIKINGKNVSFILDSGVGKTILFNISQNDNIGLNNIETVKLKGLGKGEPVEALLSKNNTLSLKNIDISKQTVYVIVKDYFDLSSKMGVTVNGIIGYNLLRNFSLKINYKFKYIDFYKSDSFEFKKCNKCEILPIEFYRKKPFVDIDVQLNQSDQKLTKVKMLIDTGGSDSMWLFEHTKKNIITPNKFFYDILGEGLSGTIYGNRSRISKLIIGDFKIENPTASFLDSLSTKNARNFKERNGSIGSNILKRFIVWLDYSKRKIMLRKNGSFKSGFNYNMSGLDVIYDGMKLIKEEVKTTYKDPYNQDVNSSNSINFITSFSYKFKPNYKINNVIKDSPADKVGLKKGDIILKINFKPSHELKLNQIMQKFEEKEGKKIDLLINRNGKKMNFKFRLEKRI